MKKKTADKAIKLICSISLFTQSIVFVMLLIQNNTLLPFAPL